MKHIRKEKIRYISCVATYIPVFLLQVQGGRKSAGRTGWHGKNEWTRVRNSVNRLKNGEKQRIYEKCFRGMVMTFITQELSTRKESDALDLYLNRNLFIFWALCQILTKSRNMQPVINYRTFKCTQIWILEAKLHSGKVQFVQIFY